MAKAQTLTVQDAKADLRFSPLSHAEPMLKVKEGTVGGGGGPRTSAAQVETVRGVWKSWRSS